MDLRAAVGDTAHPQPSPAQALAALAGLDFARHSLQDILGQVAGLARSALAPDGEASVTLLRGAEAYTAAFTGPSALILDEAQYEAGFGPCLDAAASGENLFIDDIATEQRWEQFVEVAAGAGIATSMALTLPVQDGITGALNLYSTVPGTFDDRARELGRTFAAYAAVAVGNAHLYNDAAVQARQMREAMEHRAVIEQAKGILMRDRRCPSGAAFEILRNLAEETDRPLREVAELLVEQASQQG